MKKFSLISLFAVIFTFGLFSDAMAQNDPPQIGAEQPFAPQSRPGLVQMLGLSRDQIQQLRAITRNLQPQVKQAQMNLREANLALDEAVYSDDVSDALVQERLKSVQNAQAEMVRSKTMLETSIRKILTREQLIKFRNLRQKFKPENANNRIINPNKLNNSQKQIPRRRLLRMQKRQTN